MSDVSKIMDSEHEIMKVLWEENPLTGNEICDRLVHKKDWSKSTVITLIRRLLEKGAIRSEKRGVFFYTPIITADEYKQYHTNMFLKKIFNGNAKTLVAYFCDNENLTADDLEELKEIVEKKED